VYAPNTKLHYKPFCNFGNQTYGQDYNGMNCGLLRERDKRRKGPGVQCPLVLLVEIGWTQGKAFRSEKDMVLESLLF
jgi:hypothetical protein